jgi:hypothetical protein
MGVQSVISQILTIIKIICENLCNLWITFFPFTKFSKLGFPPTNDPDALGRLIGFCFPQKNLCPIVAFDQKQGIIPIGVGSYRIKGSHHGKESGCLGNRYWEHITQGVAVPDG